MSAGMRIATNREIVAFLRLKKCTVCGLASKRKLPVFKLRKSWRFDMDKIHKIRRLFAGVPYIDKDQPDGDQGNTENKEE